MRRYLIFSDVHVPFHDEECLNTIYQVAKDKQFGIDEIVINGDFFDMYNVNSHGPKHPEVRETLEDEFFTGYTLLERLRKENPKKKITYIEGNHENRLSRFIVDKCPQFWGMVSFKKMIGLNSLDIKFLPYNSKYSLSNSKLFVQHSPPSYAQNGARTSLMRKPGGSFIYGCSHRIQHASVTSVNGEVDHVYFNGWLGNIDAKSGGRMVFHYTKNHENWQQGFVIATVVDKKHYVQQYVFNKGSVVVDGVHI